MFLIGTIELLSHRHLVDVKQACEDVGDADVKLSRPLSLKWGSSSRRFREMRTHEKSPPHR